MNINKSNDIGEKVKESKFTGDYSIIFSSTSDRLFDILYRNQEKIRNKLYKKTHEEEKLDKYEGFTKIMIKLWFKDTQIEKEIYLEDENLKIDSKNWKEIIISGIKMKVNPEGDIVEFLEGIKKGEQLFSYYSAIREAEKFGKRILSYDELFGVIHKKGVEEFSKFFPGCIGEDLSKFYSLNDSNFFSHNDIVYYRVENKKLHNNSISIFKPRYFRSKYVKLKNNDLTGIMCAEYIDKNTLFSVRCTKD